MKTSGMTALLALSPKFAGCGELDAMIAKDTVFLLASGTGDPLLRYSFIG